MKTEEELGAEMDGSIKKRWLFGTWTSTTTPFQTHYPFGTVHPQVTEKW